MKPCPALRRRKGQDDAGGSRGIRKALAGILLSLLSAGGCHRAQPVAPATPEAPLPLYIRLQVLVIGLRETPIPPDAPFPARGFRFEEGRVVPVGEPDTIAGTELTAEQFQRWMAALPKSGAPSIYVQQAFLAGPNFPASAANSEEKRYCSNWRIEAEGAKPQFDSLTPGFRVALLPLIIAGSPDLLVSADVRIVLGDLEPFKASEGFVPLREPKPGSLSGEPQAGLTPLMVQLPRQTVLHLATSTPVQSGRAIVLAHYVKQCTGMQPAREHVFYIVSAERSQKEPKSQIPIVEEILPRYALSVAWDQWEPGARSVSGRHAGVPSARPVAARGDLAEIRKAAEEMSDSPQAVSQTFSVAATAKKPLQVEAEEDRSYVAGIHRDTAEATSPRTFVLNQASAGMRLETLLEPAAGGVKAPLQGRFASPARWEERIIIVPSARLKPESLPGRSAKPAPVTVLAGGTEAYHFQTASQQFAEIQAPMELLADETRILPLTWGSTGNGPPDRQARMATVSLRCLSDADRKKESAPGEAAPVEGAVKNAAARP